jgi:hypothetical protein
MTEQIIGHLKTIAVKESIYDNISDEEIVGIDDYAAGNIDDAYALGLDEGEIYLARHLLRMVGVSYE